MCVRVYTFVCVYVTNSKPDNRYHIGYFWKVYEVYGGVGVQNNTWHDTIVVVP